MLVKISQNFTKSPLKICFISQTSVHSLWHVCSCCGSYKSHNTRKGTKKSSNLNCFKQTWAAIQWGQIFGSLSEASMKNSAHYIHVSELASLTVLL